MKSTEVLITTLLLLTAATSLPMFAGNVNLHYYNSPTANNYSGVPTYPYDISVEGGTLQEMMCLGYNEHISGGEAWRATATSVGSLDPTTHLLDYQAAFLFTMAVADRGVNSDLNAAVWWLYEGVPFLSPGAQALVALAQSQTFEQGEFSGVTLYTAIPGTESGNLGTAQNFMGTPEPGTLAMFGSGVIGLAGMLRRKFRG